MTQIFDRFLYGGDWNPEQWDEDVWSRDIAMLKDAHINEATINVFSWALLQPDESTYDFGTLDAIVRLLGDNGMSIVMATSTGALPAWMVRRHPEVIKTDIDGSHRVFGGRHNACPNSPVFRRFARDLASRLAERYAGAKGLTAWHISNEYGEMCYCPRCAEAFRGWLRRKYRTVGALNEAWCANFWSHTIHSWDDVVPPVAHGDGIGDAKAVLSGHLMDYKRFQSQSMLACYASERDAIREHDGRTPITTNLMGTFKHLDYFEWGRQMDVISWDNYPGMDTPSSFTAMTHDLMRGVGGGKPFMLMEQTPNQQNWFPYCKVKRPGEVRKLSWQAVAHGADSVQFFQLRQSIGGCERFHGAVIGHDGTERSRTYREVARIGGELERVGPALQGGMTRASVAVMFDWDSYWSLEACVGPTQGFRYPDEVHRFYRALWRLNVAVDIIPSTVGAEALERYAMVMAPVLVQVGPGVADALSEYVRRGGTVVTGYMSGLHDEHDRIVPGGYPGELRDLCGVWVEEIDALAPHERVAVLPVGPACRLEDHPDDLTRPYPACDVDGEAVCPDGASWSGEIVASLMHLEGARPLAVYGGDAFYAGSPAVTVNRFGGGRAYYIGTPLDASGMDAMIGDIVRELGIETFATPCDVEVSRRWHDDGSCDVYVINTADRHVRVSLPQLGGLTDVLAGRIVPDDGGMEIEPYGVLVIRS